MFQIVRSDVDAVMAECSACKSGEFHVFNHAEVRELIMQAQEKTKIQLKDGK